MLEHIQDRKQKSAARKSLRELKALVDYEMSLLEEFQLQEGIEATSTETQLRCLDLLAGDFDRIFLSLFSWVSPGWPTGFIFDAEDLLRRGASLRDHDLIMDYKLIMSTLVVTQPSLDRPFEERLFDAASELFSEFQWDGENAILKLEEMESDERLRKQYEFGNHNGPEIIFPGPLPIELAVETWENGERIA